MSTPDPIAEQAIAAFVRKQLSDRGRPDTELVGELARLTAQLTDCVWLRSKGVDEQTRRYLDHYERKLSLERLELVTELRGPIHGLMGGYVLVPNGGDTMLVPNQFPWCAQRHQPAWRTGTAAANVQAQLSNPAELHVEWTPVVATDRGDDYILLDDRTWRAVGNPSIVSRDHFEAHPWDREAELHVLAVPPEGLAQGITAGYARILADQWGLTPIRPEGLHWTIWSGRGSPELDTTDAADRLATALANFGPIRAELGPATSNAEGFQLAMSPHTELAALTGAVRRALGGHTPQFWRPHVSLAYTFVGDGLLDGTGLNHVTHRWTWNIDAVQLVEMTRDPVEGRYQWETLATIKTAAAPS